MTENIILMSYSDKSILSQATRKIDMPVNYCDMLRLVVRYKLKFDNDCDVMCVQNVIKDRVYVTYSIVFHRVLGS